MWKDKLDGPQKIIEYIQELDSNFSLDCMELYTNKYGENFYAILKEVDIHTLIESDNDVLNTSKQHKYNNMRKDTQPPILIDDNFHVIDGNHRYRSSLRRNDETILVYQIYLQ